MVGGATSRPWTRSGRDEALETAMRGVADTSAQVVVLDITGVKGVDSSVAATLGRDAGLAPGTTATREGYR